LDHGFFMLNGPHVLLFLPRSVSREFVPQSFSFPLPYNIISPPLCAQCCKSILPSFTDSLLPVASLSTSFLSFLPPSSSLRQRSSLPYSVFPRDVESPLPPPLPTSSLILRVDRSFHSTLVSRSRSSLFNPPSIKVAWWGLVFFQPPSSPSSLSAFRPTEHQYLLGSPSGASSFWVTHTVHPLSSRDGVSVLVRIPTFPSPPLSTRQSLPCFSASPPQFPSGKFYPPTLNFFSFVRFWDIAFFLVF